MRWGEPRSYLVAPRSRGALWLRVRHRSGRNQDDGGVALPYVFLPQLAMVPLALSAQAKYWPALTETKSPPKGGAAWEALLSPQHTSEPSVLTTQAKPSDALTDRKVRP